MKKTFLLALSLVLTQLIAHSQYYTDSKRFESGSVAIPDTVLLADETTLTWGKTEAKIHCYNETVFKKLHQAFDTIFKRYTCVKKKDRHGEYKLYTIYLNKEDGQLIYEWAKTNL